jgi:hypothetical protein
MAVIDFVVQFAVIGAPVFGSFSRIFVMWLLPALLHVLVVEFAERPLFAVDFESVDQDPVERYVGAVDPRGIEEVGGEFLLRVYGDG